MSRNEYRDTGHSLERRVFGVCAAPYKGWLEWRAAVEDVRRNQPAGGLPETARRLVAEIKRLGEEDVTFLTAAGGTASLDRDHHVDGLFVFVGVVLPVDLTANDEKTHVARAEVIAKEELENLPRLAARLVRIANERRDRNNGRGIRSWHA